MTNAFKGGVIGCGRMGAFTSEIMRKHALSCWHPLNHAEAMRLHPHIDLAALCDIDRETLTTAGKVHGVDRLYRDPDSMLAEEKPDIIAIATRTIGRAELIEKAIGSGVRAIHTEKPLCNTVAEVERLAGYLSDPDLFVTFGTIRRFFPLFEQARELAHSGQYGAVREIRVALGPGALYWSHPHSIDLILFLVGDRVLEGVQARLSGVELDRSTVISDPIVDSATLYFSEGVIGHITRAIGYSFTITCENAEIIVARDGDSLSILACPKGDIYPELTPYPHPRTNLGPGGSYGPIAMLASCLLGDSAAVGQNAVVKEDIILGQRIAFAMVQSHREGSRILLPKDVDDNLAVLARSGSGLHA